MKAMLQKLALGCAVIAAPLACQAFDDLDLQRNTTFYLGPQVGSYGLGQAGGQGEIPNMLKGIQLGFLRQDSWSFGLSGSLFEDRRYDLSDQERIHLSQNKAMAQIGYNLFFSRSFGFAFTGNVGLGQLSFQHIGPAAYEDSSQIAFIASPELGLLWADGYEVYNLGLGWQISNYQGLDGHASDYSGFYVNASIKICFEDPFVMASQAKKKDSLPNQQASMNTAMK